jgi:hypothetical protein
MTKMLLGEHAQNGELLKVQRLLSDGQVNVTKHGWTSLVFDASKNGQLDTLKWLLTNSDFSVRAQHRRKSLALAAAVLIQITLF